jgi:hypothetical protein
MSIINSCFLCFKKLVTPDANFEFFNPILTYTHGCKIDKVIKRQALTDPLKTINEPLIPPIPPLEISSATPPYTPLADFFL